MTTTQKIAEQPPLRFVDAFAGAGGLTLGLQAAGLKPLLSFDNDPISVRTLQTNTDIIRHPTILEDARNLVNGELLRAVGLTQGELELMAGGPPCQGFSIQRIGDDTDIRNDLVLLFGQLVIEAMPRMFLMENVTGLAGARGQTTLKEFTRRLQAAGYYVHVAVLDAQDFGVPQRRRRLFLVGEQRDSPLLRFRFPNACPGNRKTVRDAIGHLPAPPADHSDHPSYPGHRSDRLSDLNRKRLEALGEGEGRDDLPDDLLAECHRRDSSAIGHRNVYGRMSWDSVSPTITARFDSFTRGQFGHPEQIRTISLYEGQLLQTFPANYRFSGNKVEVARQIGNAVPPSVARMLGRAIFEAEKGVQSASVVH